MSYLLQYYDRGFAGNPYDAGGDRGMSLDFLPQEFPCYGTGDFLWGGYDLLHFHGRHTMERNLERVPPMHGKQSFGSRRGTSSHQHNPFVVLAESGTTEDFGGCYGMALLYSGNFSFEVEQDQFGQTRMQIGMLDEMMDYPLAPGECLYTPEAAMAYSADGLAALSHIYHEMIRNHVCRGKYKNARRPVLINNWEATYFHFTAEKIGKLAEQAADLAMNWIWTCSQRWRRKRYGGRSGIIKDIGS